MKFGVQFFCIALSCIFYLVISESFLETQRKWAEQQLQMETNHNEEEVEYIYEYVYEYVDEASDYAYEYEVSSEGYAEEVKFSPPTPVHHHKPKRGFLTSISTGIKKAMSPYNPEELLPEAERSCQCLSQAAMAEMLKTPLIAVKTDDKTDKKNKKKPTSLESAPSSGAKVPQGQDCETLICGACKAVVEEFSLETYDAIDNPRVQYIYDIAETFCNQKNIKLKYNSLVGAVCDRVLDEDGGYRDNFVRPFEMESDLEAYADPVSIYNKKQKFCTTVGLCTLDQFAFNSKPKNQFQEHWDEKCYVCQAVAKDVEERIMLLKAVSESAAVAAVKSTCKKLNLPSALNAHCEAMVTPPLLDEIGWIAKMHSESLQRKDKSDKTFADRMCEEVKLCEKWVDPSDIKNKMKDEDMVFW